MRPSREIVDDMLVLSCQRGDARAFELLARHWHPRLVRHAYRLTGNADAAADAVQEAWIGIVRGIGRLQDPSKFGAWAYQIVQNKTRDGMRKEARRRDAFDALQSEAPVEGQGPAGAEDEIQVLRRAIATLTPEQQTVLRLFYMEDRSVGEIARIVDLPSGTVKSRLFYARRRLGAVLATGSVASAVLGTEKTS